MSVEDVRKLHCKFPIYYECEHDQHEDSPEAHGGITTIYIEDMGYVCDEPTMLVCYECDTDDGELNEHSEYGEWPCRTLIELEKL